MSDNIKVTEHNLSHDNNTDPKSLLSQLMQDKNVSFEMLKKKLKDEGYDGADDLSSVNSLPKLKVFELIQRLKKAKAKA